ncbi:MAG: glutamate racemase [Candidatus Margulisiibacteriota bacterium]|nr:MAG: glutamate racemase [Candidatus Margulisbacteria bacterium GWD2_39_127]OGI02889.1 MAG: glutamate racemase [Candidatus Margulisbacteria bacterium GWF2_38_17]OGI06815.1 MAG: glutamate racemase [Candidatus Margulisbacteria bacterium GWE2_39_32]PZM83003.1 MAG: glutamate racemase [Candidatus Margulisiibacteriota bacterium]HAR62163.1 glutamate racemase [Candidatus Margulisiibacteriota bacterium]
MYRLDQRPIGMFDSGFGGLTVLAQVKKLLPQENVLYYGDNLRAPYGGRTKEEIIGFNHEIVEFMLEKQVKAIIMACNTSTSHALQHNRDHFDVPFVSLIERGIDMVSEISKTRNVAVMATEGTVRSKSFTASITSRFDNIKVMEIACPLLVPIIENGSIHDEKTRDIASQYLSEALHQQADVVILGCTHYPFLVPVLQKIAPEHVTFIDPAVGASEYIKKYLEKNELLNKSNCNGNYEYYTSGDTIKFQECGSRLLGFSLENVQHKSF